MLVLALVEIECIVPLDLSGDSLILVVFHVSML